MIRKFLPTMLSLGLVTTAVVFVHRGMAQENAGAQPAVKTIEITAKRYGFSPSEITLKKGEPVKLVLKTSDVTHGLFLRPLKIDAIVAPGDPQEVNITPEKTGDFTAVCDHFCGAGHSDMNMTVHVVD